jgi:hypothetical protein
MLRPLTPLSPGLPGSRPATVSAEFIESTGRGNLSAGQPELAACRLGLRSRSSGLRITQRRLPGSIPARPGPLTGKRPRGIRQWQPNRTDGDPRPAIRVTDSPGPLAAAARRLPPWQPSVVFASPALVPDSESRVSGRGSEPRPESLESRIQVWRPTLRRSESTGPGTRRLESEAQVGISRT